MTTLRHMLLLAALLLGSAVLVPGYTQANQDTRCFEETGFCVEGAIRGYWERNGGLAVFGYPISAMTLGTVEDWRGPLQWFERDRLEDHGTTGVLAGRLGARLLELRQQPWQSLPQVADAPPGCAYFPETRHSLCEPFLRYWRNNGGLERFGYPISEPFIEQIGDWVGTVQYFERRRMEHHTEYSGTRYEVLLGLLGSAVRNFQPADACPTLPQALHTAYNRLTFATELGCPTAPPWDVPVVVQRFVNGEMIWVDLLDGHRRIYVIFSDDNRAPGFYYRLYEDTWSEDEPVSTGLEPPGPGLYEPQRGFGKVWREQPGVREVLGWAWEPEQEFTGAAHPFDSGFMFQVNGKNWIYTFGRYETQIGSMPADVP